MADSTGTNGTDSTEGTDQGSQGTEDQNGTDQQGQDGTDDATDFDSLPEATKAEIRKLRSENRRLRKSGKAAPGTQDATAPTGQAAILAKLAEALGLEMGEPVTTKTTTTKQDSGASELRLAQVELAVYKVATAAGADPDALLDSRSFLSEIEDLDPSDASFTKDVREAVKTAVGQNASLKAKVAGGQQKTPPGKSGGDLTGGRGSKQEEEFLTPQQLLAAAYAANST